MNGLLSMLGGLGGGGGSYGGGGAAQSPFYNQQMAQQGLRMMQAPNYAAPASSKGDQAEDAGVDRRGKRRIRIGGKTYVEEDNAPSESGY